MISRILLETSTHLKIVEMINIIKYTFDITKYNKI
jgi:hypothetical protein